MVAAGGGLFAAGVAGLLLGLGGYRLRRVWAGYDPGDAPLTAAGRFQLARQRSFMRQAPFWTLVGGAMTLVGAIGIVVGKITGS